MPITINFVTNLKEILFIADGGSTNEYISTTAEAHTTYILKNTYTNGHISTTTEAHTTDILKNTWAVALSVVVLVCLLIGGVIIYKSKEIFFNYFLAK